MARVSALLLAAGIAAAQQIQYEIYSRNVTAPWTRAWQECVGSGHAALALRADYQQQLAAVRRDLGMKRVRMHGLLNDDMSVVLPAFDAPGNAFYFFNVDRVFDSFLAMGVRPLVELSFMPGLLASGNQTWSWYKSNVSPPANWSDWSNLITSLVQHLVDRYGLDEVLTWNFEVWNEPNCCGSTPVFWPAGLQQYFKLFALTSAAAKSVDPRIRVGGPATSALGNITDFLSYMAANDVAFDFISTHLYPTDPPGPFVRTFMYDQLTALRALVGPSREIYITEWDDAFNDDGSYSAAFITFQARALNGVVDLLSFWPFSDLFEEGAFNRPNGLAVDGLVNVYGIPKPSYRAFQLLAGTGDGLLAVQPDFFTGHPTVGVYAIAGGSPNLTIPSASAPGSSAGSAAAAAAGGGGNLTRIIVTNWNVKGAPISDVNVTLVLHDMFDAGGATAVSYRIDDTHGNAYPAWAGMGSPAYLSPAQVASLSAASEMQPAIQALFWDQRDFVATYVTVPANSVVCVIITDGPGAAARTAAAATAGAAA